MNRSLPCLLALSCLASAAVFAEEAPKKAAEGGANPMIVIETSLGTIKAELYADKAPISVKNFLSYVEKGHYDNTIFHRAIANFMIQGGGFDTARVQKKTDPPIKNESANGLKNDRGTLAMARTSAPDSATAQFFINVVDNSFLNKAGSQDGVGYTVFGKVTEGMDVVDKIRNVKTARSNLSEAEPLEQVVIKSIRAAK